MPASSPHALEARQLRVHLGAGRQRRDVLQGLDLSLASGRWTAIVGPNGAGKTTYFNLISGQLRATAGRVTLGGRDLSTAPASERTRAGLGRAFQLTNLFPRLTVLENDGGSYRETATVGPGSPWRTDRPFPLELSLDDVF